MENALLHSHWLATLVDAVPRLTSYNINRCSTTIIETHTRLALELDLLRDQQLRIHALLRLLDHNLASGENMECRK